MPRIDSTLTTLAVAAIIAGSIVYTVQYLNNAPGGLQALGLSNVMAANAAEAKQSDGGAAGQPATAQGEWAATAAGKVEPEGGVIRVVPEMSGVVTDVLVKTGDKVKAGDLLFVLRDDELRARWQAARTEIDVRKRERAEDPIDEEEGNANAKKSEEPKPKPRADAEDALGDAQLKAYEAQRALDDAYIAWRKGNASEESIEPNRKALADARQALETARKAAADVRANPDTALPTRLEGGLESARNDLAVIETMLQRARVRAPRDGIILDVEAKVGEMRTPSPQAPAIELGNTDELIVRSELEERDLTAVQKGQRVVIRSNAFPGQDFAGTVRLVAPSLSAPKLSGRGPRAASDVDVVEVEISLDGKPPLITGMRVDVFFKQPGAKEQASAN
ncbi:MAG: efflux RND transporter periplasmic adaptor subunit [Pseudomonadota bacterium]